MHNQLLEDFITDPNSHIHTLLLLKHNDRALLGINIIIP